MHRSSASNSVLTVDVRTQSLMAVVSRFQHQRFSNRINAIGVLGLIGVSGAGERQTAFALFSSACSPLEQEPPRCTFVWLLLSCLTFSLVLRRAWPVLTLCCFP